MANDITEYSDKFKGAPGNFEWPVKFDLTRGYLGIQQYEGDKPTERVLLSPAQVRHMLAFLNAQPPTADGGPK